jgi:hypothetical protein
MQESVTPPFVKLAFHLQGVKELRGRNLDLLLLRAESLRNGVPLPLRNPRRQHSLDAAIPRGDDDLGLNARNLPCRLAV